MNRTFDKLVLNIIAVTNATDERTNSSKNKTVFGSSFSIFLYLQAATGGNDRSDVSREKKKARVEAAPRHEVHTNEKHTQHIPTNIYQ